METDRRLTVLSLFDGLAGGLQACKEEGLNIKKYYASEIDPYAIKIAMHNHPEIIQLGDITKWRDWDIDWDSIDMVIGGSPCQDLSNYKYDRNEVEGLNGSKSKLFY